MAEEVRLYKRQWLNPAEGFAAVEAKVSYTEKSRAEGNAYMDAHFALSDCNRKVVLDFDVYSAEGLEKYEAKVKRLRAAVTQFEREFLAVAEDVRRANGW